MLTHRKFRNTGRFLVPIFLILLFLFTGCRDSLSEGPREIPAGSKEVEDSLRVGNLDFANTRIAEMLKSAADSDNYIAWRVIQSVADYYSGQPDSLTNHSAEAISWLDNHSKNPTRLRLLFRALQTRAGFFTQYSFNADSSIHYQQKALNVAEELGDHRLVQQASANLGDAYKMSGELAQSSFHYHRALALADSLKMERTDYVPVICGLASVYTALENFDESRVWWDRAGKYWDVMMAHERFNYLNNRGNDWYLQKNYEKALESFRELRKYIVDNGGTEWEAHFCDANLSDVLIRIGCDEEAKHLIENNLRYFSEISPNTYVYNHVITQAMRMNMNAGNYAEVDRLIAANPLGKDIRNEQFLGRYEFLSDYYTKRGIWDKAYSARESYRLIDDSIHNAKVKLGTADLQNRYRHDSQMLELKSDIAKHRSRIMTNYVVVAAAVAMCAILCVIIIVIRNRARRKESRMLMRILNLKMDNVKRRITPHFIYNCINQEVIAKERGEADNLEGLVNILRRQQQLATEFTVPLEQELLFIDDYIRIIGQRVSGNLIYRLHLLPEIVKSDVRIPAMAIQILVENAFKHGFPSLPAGADKIIDINVEHSDGYYTITVINNAGESSITHHDGINDGLKIIVQSIEILNGHNSEKINFDVEPTPMAGYPGGYKAIISIPEKYDFLSEHR